MQLIHIAVFIVGALVYAAFVPPRQRGWALLIASVIALYWLQPTLTIRYLDFVLPTATLALTVAVWWVTNHSENPSPHTHSGDMRLHSGQPPRARTGGETAESTASLLTGRDREGLVNRENRLALIVIAALVIGLSLTRYLVPELRPTASRAPDTPTVIAALALLGGLSWALWRRLRRWPRLLTGMILLIVVMFVVVKTDPLAVAVSAGLRSLTGQDVTLARFADLEWLGFSYVAFRLIHTLRERQMGRLPALTLREFVTYVIFFPAITAGPIDRAERFVKDDRAIGAAAVSPLPPGEGTEGRVSLLTSPRLIEAGGRITIGLFKKFVIADSLAILALNAANAGQTTSAGSLWVLLYGYAFRLFFDFSGYTDIAIGIGVLLGFRLPENFDRPYLKNNLAAFWQSWHMTLSNWVRFYVFSPLSRALLARKTDATVSVLLAQLATMLIIGLWHGVTWGFVIWGLWHGLGLFVHKRWSDRTRQWYLRLNQRPRLKQAWTAAGVLLTFHFVTLGWVWFALATDVTLAGRVFLGLFGVQP